MRHGLRYRRVWLASLLLLGSITVYRPQRVAAQGATAPQPEVARAQHSDAPDIKLPANYQPAYAVLNSHLLGSTYIPVDSWMYPALIRLQGLGYLDTGYLGLRPWTRLSTLHMLESTGEEIARDRGTASDEAESIYLALVRELAADAAMGGGHAELDTVYTRFLGITNTPLRDSFHLGQTVINDYGRPYQAGISNFSGASGRAEFGRFTLAVRGEYQEAPSALGYSDALSNSFSTLDKIPLATNPVQATIPRGPLAGVSNLCLLEATASIHLLGHEISFGKNDRWWGPAQGGAYAYSNNADNIYAFEINRVEPIRIPLLSRLTGPFRYDFFVGDLQGHTAPNAPWIHGEKISFKPSRNVELGFERTVLWGGRGHEPITIHTFLESFFSVQNVSLSSKISKNDPGARFGTFDFSYRLPFVRDWLTLYTDSLAHDDVNPTSAPRRAAIRPGIYLSHFPMVPHLDLRVEAASTDPPTSRSRNGEFLDAEGIQLQGTTNKGLLFGDAIGRENKGGQAWLTYHLSAAEHVQLTYRTVKAANNFIAGGTTQQEFKADVIKHVGENLEVRGWVQYEEWKAPIYRPGSNTDVSVSGQLTWYPHISRVF